MHIRGSWPSKTPPKFHEKTFKREAERAKWWREREKRAKFWAVRRGVVGGVRCSTQILDAPTKILNTHPTTHLTRHTPQDNTPQDNTQETTHKTQHTQQTTHTTHNTDHIPPEHYFCCAQCNDVTLGVRPPIQLSAVGDRSLMWPRHITGTPGCSTPLCSVPLTLHTG